MKKVKLSFNVKSTADWLALAGLVIIVIQFVAQLFGFEWSSENTNQAMNAVNIIISALATFGLLRNTDPTDVDKKIDDVVKESTDEKK